MFEECGLNVLDFVGEAYMDYFGTLDDIRIKPWFSNLLCEALCRLLALTGK